MMFCLTLAAMAGNDKGQKNVDGYLMVYFESSGDKNTQEHLRFAVSEDGWNWYSLNGNQPIVSSDTISGSGGIRDPYVFRSNDGYYYIVATDVCLEKNIKKENPDVVVLKSDNLIEWQRISKSLLPRGYNGMEYEMVCGSKTAFAEKAKTYRKDFSPCFGTTIPVSSDELERLQQKWGYVLTHEFESHGNPIVHDKFTTDPAVFIENDTLWMFTGHDADGHNTDYVMKDWLLYSTADMVHWTEYPSPLRITDFAWAESKQAYAGQVIKRNGKYFWYISTNWCGIGVAVSDRITGPYRDVLGKPLLTNKDCFASKHSWACIDPSVIIDDDGTAYLVWGNGQCYYAKLKENMIEIDGEVHQIDVPRYTEGPWIHKYNGKYYLTYASEWPEKIAYAVADNIGGPYTPMGVISDYAENSGTTHPAIVEYRGQWLFFSHNGTLPNGSGYSRSVIAEPMRYDADGRILPIPHTEKGATGIFE